MTQAKSAEHRPVSRQCISNLAKRGVPVCEWRRKKGVRGEALDGRVYAFAALQPLASTGLSLDRGCERSETLTASVLDQQPPRVSYGRWTDAQVRNRYARAGVASSLRRNGTASLNV